MKVLKFGGSSVGTAQSIVNVKQIVEATPQPAVIVVSALGGVTDQLLTLSQKAAAGDETYRAITEALAERHHNMVADVIVPSKQAHAHAQIETLMNELRSILHGVFLIQDLTTKTSDAIVSYGERLSSVIVTALLNEAQHFDAQQLIKTTRPADKHVVDFEITNTLVRKAFDQFSGCAVLDGFIASDAQTGVTTHLGRGGSDYTASIIAAALEAEALEIWTDVDGFMTADPRIIPTAYTIDELSYDEAMELCNFGAKVIYPPTIYPVCVKNIPIFVRNTFKPSGRGSVIRKDIAPATRPIRGISSVNSMSLVTVSGLSMVGVIGVNRRIFTTLAAGEISVFMVAQTSSETSTSMCVTPEDGPRACRLLDAEFAKEIEDGAMFPAQLQEGLASVGVVGERMKHTPGIAGKLFSVLGRNGISICAVALGALEMNISLVIEQAQLRKALNVLHDSFFLSEYQELNLFVCGTGTVGNKLIEQIAAQRELLMRERGLKINLLGVSGRSKAIYPTNYKEAMKIGGSGGIDRMVQEIIDMNPFNSVFVDCTASPEVAEKYETLLRHNISVVAANKIAASGSFESYQQLKQTARERGVKYLFETNVGAGLPVINTINDLTGSGDRILRIQAVLSGTLNYVFNTLSADISLSQAVRMAQENGYSEPDPRIDLSGKDVIRKLTILARESGYRVETDEVEARLFIPEELFAGTLEEFWEKLPSLDAEFEAARQRLAAEDKCWRFVAEWNNGHGSVGLREIERGHPFYALEGSNNIVCLTTERYKEYPMLIQGYGAGADVTAAGVFADIMRVANI